MVQKAFHTEADMGALPMHEVVNLHNRLFITRNYDWWRTVSEGDVVVDIGAGVGLFSALALDVGAKRVYMVEPSETLLKTAIGNVSDYIIGRSDPVVIPIHAGIGKTDVDLGNVFGIRKRIPGSPEAPLMSLRQLCETHDIRKIDFLKIAAEGAEFGILSDDARDFCAQNVRHMAIMIHINAQYGSDIKFAQWRDQFLKPFRDLGRVKFQDNKIEEKMYADNFKELLPDKFMIYITNW